jgi:hypothetical protein
MKIRLILPLFFAIFNFSNAYCEEEDLSASGYNKQRIEMEDKLFVPMEKADAVWAYLENKYVKDQDYLRSIDPALSSNWMHEEFWDTYYDTPSFQLLAMQSGVRHRKRINHTDPSDVKSGRELMQIKQNNIDGNVLRRGETKYDIEPPAYSVSDDDAHGMLHLVKPEQREGFKARLKAMGLDPSSMMPIVTVHDMRSRIYIKKDGNPFMSVSFDRVDARIWWATANFIEIEPELNEIAYTDADPATRQYMETVLQKIIENIQHEFPDIQRNLTPKYNKSFNILNDKLPFMKLLISTGLHGSDAMLIVVFVLVMLCALGYSILQKSRLKLPKNRIAA